MSPRVAAVVVSALFAVACNKESTASKDAGPVRPTSGPQRSVSSVPPPAEGPCATDADCKVYLEPCSCMCLAHVGEVPDVPNDKWSTMCSGSPPSNCGVASPCMNVGATCDAATKKCALKR